MRFRPLSHVLCSLALAPVSFAVKAQVTPDAGSLRQQIEQQMMPSLPDAAPAPAVKPPPEIRPQQGVKVFVKEFRVGGNTLLQTSQLLPAVASFTNQELDFAGLQRAADAIAAVYREAGWIVRVYLPEQDVSAGVVTLYVVEAKFAGTRFEGDAPRWVRQDVIERYFSAHQAVGAPLSATDMDRALLLADDLPGVHVAGTLTQGEADGETALVLQTKDEALAYGDVSVDNTGARSTGSTRLRANLAINSPLGWGEQLTFNGLHTEGMTYGRAGLTAPVGYSGLRLGVNASQLTYNVIEGPGSESDIRVRGRSNSFGFDASYPLIRDRLKNLYVTASFDNKTFLNRDTLIRSDYATRSARLGLSGNSFDDFGGGGSNTLLVQSVWGRLGDMNVHPLMDTIHRSYNKIDYSLSRLQKITADHSLFVSWQGQHATRSLDSSEKFYIGGAQSVRAYPASEIGGDRGQVVSVEWRWRVLPDLQLSAFGDYGRVTSIPATANDVQVSSILKGYGLSATWQGPYGLVTRLTWARRSGANPQPTATGTDGDGTRKLNRFWLTASIPF